MSNTFRTQVDELVRKSRKIYELNHSRIFSDSKQESALIEEYNGRQVLELLQNADDAGAGKVQISLDTSERTLSFSNTGDPFTVDGVQSLMLAHSSPKSKKVYIGNKGLGFRSILNWAERVEILANDCCLSFSAENTARQFRALNISDEAMATELSKRNLALDFIPLATLAIPDIMESSQSDAAWTTTIKITYHKDYEQDILHQLSGFREEYLLFLNHVLELSISGLPEGELSFIKDPSSTENQVSINGKNWKINALENPLPENLQDKKYDYISYYSLRIAYTADLSDNVGQLFTYFPTSVPVRLPCVIHGTFELDNPRKYLNDSKINKYILGKLADLLLDTAETLKDTPANWLPFTLLKPQSEITDHKLIAKLYEDLSKAREQAAIYPTIGGSYRNLATTRYYCDEFSDFVRVTDITGFEELMLPAPEEISEARVDSVRPYSNYTIQSLIETLIGKITDTALQTDLIYLIYSYLSSHHKSVKYAILTSDKGEIIPLSKTAFTPALAEKDIARPDFINLEVMSLPLYEALVVKMGSASRPLQPRELQSRLKDITKIQDYDVTDITEKIITGTQDRIRTQRHEEKVQSVKQMVQALWLNYVNHNRSATITHDVPLISRNGNIYTNKTLFLGNSYPSGGLTEDIFAGIYGDQDYLLDAWEWEILSEEEDPVALQTLERFFIWLGIQQLVRLTPYKRSAGPYDGFSQYIRDHVSSIALSVKEIRIDGMALQSYDRLKGKISKEALLLWIIQSGELKRFLDSSVTDRIDWLSTYNSWNYIPAHPSYIRYQLEQLHPFGQYVIEDYNIPVINKFRIDYQHPLFVKYGISRPEVDSILLKLGATSSFAELAPKRVFEIINELRSKDPEGTYSQRVYRIALDWLDDSKTFTRPNLYLYARTDGNGEYIYAPNTYYSDNQTLPKRITDEFPVLNLTKRAGEDKVNRLFGVRLFKDMQLQIEESSVRVHPLNEEFQKRWTEMKPLILAHRLDKLSVEQVKRDAATQLKLCEITLVSACSYLFGERKITMEPNELINSGNRYCLMASASYHQLSQLQKDSLFCDAFAEVLCIQFKVNELKNTFRSILINDISDSSHVIADDLSEGLIAEVNNLLGLSGSLHNFWQTIYRLKGLELPENIPGDQMLLAQVSADLGIEASLSESEPGKWNRQSVEWLKATLQSVQVSPSDYFIAAGDECGLQDYHLSQIANELYNQEDAFKIAYWQKLSTAGQLEQSNFINGQHEYLSRARALLIKTLQPYRYELDLPLADLVKAAIEESYKVTLIPVGPAPEPKMRYADLLCTFQHQPDDLSNELKSLLYFDGNKEFLKEELKKLATHSTDATEITGGPPPIPQATEISTGDLIPVTYNPTSDSSSGRRPWTAHPSRSQRQHEIGKTSEEIVKAYLEITYGADRVKWRSGFSESPDNNDNLQYDVLYKNEEDIWKFVEVKTLGPSGFTISQPEVSKGQDNADNYEIFLVQGSQIYIIRDFFRFKPGESFESNSQYTVSTRDYNVYFRISQEAVRRRQ